MSWRSPLELAEPRTTQEALALLRPSPPTADPTFLRRHMDACVAAAVRLGVTAGAALAVYGAVMEQFASDLVRADHELVHALTQLLGLG